MAESKMDSVFDEVTGFLRESELDQLYDLDRCWKQFTSKYTRVHLTRSGQSNKLIMRGSLYELVEFENMVRRASHSSVIYGEFNQKAIGFLQDILHKRWIKPQSDEREKRTRLYHTYDLITLLLTFLKNSEEIQKRAAHVSVLRTDTVQETESGANGHDQIRLKYSGEITKANELFEYIQELYDEERQKKNAYIQKNVRLSEAYVHKYFHKNRETLVVSENCHAYVLVSMEVWKEFDRLLKETTSESSYDLSDDSHLDSQEDSSVTVSKGNNHRGSRNRERGGEEHVFRQGTMKNNANDQYADKTVQSRISHQEQGYVKERSHERPDPVVSDEDDTFRHHGEKNIEVEDKNGSEASGQTAHEWKRMTESDEEEGNRRQYEKGSERKSSKGQRIDRTKNEEVENVRLDLYNDKAEEKHKDNTRTHKKHEKRTSRREEASSDEDERDTKEKDVFEGNENGNQTDYSQSQSGMNKNKTGTHIKYRQDGLEREENYEGGFRNDRKADIEDENRRSNQSRGANETIEAFNQSTVMDYGQFDKTAEDLEVRSFTLDIDAVNYIRRFCVDWVAKLEHKFNVKLEFVEKGNGNICVLNTGEISFFKGRAENVASELQGLYDKLKTVTIDITNRERTVSHFWDTMITMCGRVNVLCIRREADLVLVGKDDEVIQMKGDIETLLGVHKPRERKLVKSTSLDSSTSDESLGSMQRLSSSVYQTGHHKSIQPVRYQHEKSKVIVHTSVGDITRLNVDVIVNAANSDLYHVGGLAKAIVIAGGPTIQKQSDDHRRKFGPLKFKKVCVTDSGALRCNKVFHVAGPRYSECRDDKECVDLLMGTFTAVLKKASESKHESIAIPPISSGIFGVPAYLVADCLCKSVSDFLQKNTTLKSVHLIDLQAATVGMIQKQLDFYVEKGLFCKVKDFAGVHDPNLYRGNPTARHSQHSLDEGAAGGNPAGKKGSERPVTSQPKPSAQQPPKTESASAGGTRPKTTDSSKKSEASHTATFQQQGDKKKKDHKEHDANSANSKNKFEDKTSKGPDVKQANATTEEKKEKEDETCCICMCEMDDPKTLKCKHTFCKECIDRGMKVKPVCPICGAVYGKITGNQPKNGTMRHHTSSGRLPGYGSCGTIEILYSFPSGIQTEEHDHPGRSYTGTNRRAYLPDNKEGRHVLKLLEEAFKARLVFTVGSSRTTGATDTVTWNDIHHKTNTYGGADSFGYPDPTYLSRVKEELAAKGIK